MTSGEPAAMSCTMPIPSEWSATTNQSSGRESFTGCPLEATTSSPRANRYASGTPSRLPNNPASMDSAVCRWLSPHRGRLGKARWA